MCVCECVHTHTSIYTLCTYIHTNKHTYLYGIGDDSPYWSP